MSEISSPGITRLVAKSENPRERTPQNLGDSERSLSKVGGLLLGIYGLSRGSFKGLLIAGAGGMLYRRGATGYCPLYNALDINRAKTATGPNIIRIEETITISRSPLDLYRYWRSFDNLPLFMSHISDVQRIDDSHSHWKLRLASGLGSLEWDAELIEDVPEERLSWRSLPGAELHNAGTVTFRQAPGNRGTEVSLAIVFYPPGGKFGLSAAKLANPLFNQMVREDMRRFKSLMEAGEIPTIEGQPAGP